MPQTFVESLLSSFGQAAEMDRQKRLDKQAEDQRKVENERAEQQQQLESQRMLAQIPLQQADADRAKAEADYYKNRLPAQQEAEAKKASATERKAAFQSAFQGLKTGMTLEPIITMMKGQYPDLDPQEVQGFRLSYGQMIQAQAQRENTHRQEMLTDWQGRTGLTVAQYAAMSPMERDLKNIEPPPMLPGPIPSLQDAQGMAIETDSDRRTRAQDERAARVEQHKDERERRLAAFKEQQQTFARQKWDQQYGLEKSKQHATESHQRAQEQMEQTSLALKKQGLALQRQRVGLEGQRLDMERRRVAVAEGGLKVRQEHEARQPFIDTYKRIEGQLSAASINLGRQRDNVESSVTQSRALLRQYGIDASGPITPSSIDKAVQGKSLNPATLQSIYAAAGRVEAGPDVMKGIEERMKDLDTDRAAAQQHMRDLGVGPTKKDGSPSGAGKGGSKAGAAKTLTADIAAHYLRQFHGDRAKAEAQARQEGYQW